MIQFKECIGSELIPHIEDLARLRISVFREFPYLYDGNMEYERNYLNTYAQSHRSYAVLAMDDKKVVGASTAIPLEDETDEVTAPFLRNNHNHTLSEILYMGESILETSYRGRGIGKSFFRYRESYGLRLHRSSFTFCAVVRADDHPFRPADYLPLHDFWNKIGYQPLEGYLTTFSWQDADEASQSAKQMQFWGKGI